MARGDVSGLLYFPFEQIPAIYTLLRRVPYAKLVPEQEFAVEFKVVCNDKLDEFMPINKPSGILGHVSVSVGPLHNNEAVILIDKRCTRHHEPFGRRITESWQERVEVSGVLQ